jgi:hypothetical protein
MAGDWLSRLERTRRLTPLTREEEGARPLPGLGGLCGGAIPEAVRRSRGWTPLISTDLPTSPRPSRRGDFFRCD